MTQRGAPPADAAASELPAGDYRTWLGAMERALRGETDSTVPCGSCTACCTSHQFVHITPDETDALGHIPRELLFPAPGAPAGHVLMGYDELGRCPMLGDDGCSIYPHRPQACRMYDCRVFAATGVDVDEEKPAIARQVARWRFTHPSPVDRRVRAAVEAAAAYVERHPDLLPDGIFPSSTTRAVLAVELHTLFLADHGEGEDGVLDPGYEAVREEVRRLTGRRTT